jgi:hypothetical protein
VRGALVELDEKMLSDIKKLNLASLRQVTEQGEKFIPRVHVIGEDGVYVVFTPFTDDEEKVEMLKEVGILAYEKKAHQIVVVCDALLKHYDNEKDYKFALENWETERPSLYPEDRRTDALLILVLDFKDINKEKSIVLPYKIEDKKLVMLEGPPDQSGSDTNGLIKSVLCESVAQAKIMDTLKFNMITPETISEMGVENMNILMKDIEKDIGSEYPNLLGNIRPRY